jgi:metal-responsive CopG/Arc/MetJ family transcriptional regulator
MSTTPVATRVPDDVARQIDHVAENPATELDSRSEVVRQLVVQSLDQ